MINKTITFAKQHTPNSARVAARRAMLEGHNARVRLTVPVVARSEFQNIYHCAMRKTASQWITAMFSDPIAYRYSGLLPYVPRYYKWQHPEQFPTGRVALSLFLSHQKYATVPKPPAYRTFFVMRDPRDIMVSGYFSTRNSHAPMGDIPELRKVLMDKPFKDGLLYLIAYHGKKGTFRALKSWATAAESDDVRLFRYEDLTGPRQPEEFARLLEHCRMPMPADEQAALLDKYSFARMGGGSTGGGTQSHYRKGSSGDWRNHFDDDVYAAFEKAAGNLIKLLGYPPRESA